MPLKRYSGSSVTGKVCLNAGQSWRRRRRRGGKGRQEHDCRATGQFTHDIISWAVARVVTQLWLDQFSTSLITYNWMSYTIHSNARQRAGEANIQAVWASTNSNPSSKLMRMMRVEAMVLFPKPEYLSTDPTPGNPPSKLHSLNNLHPLTWWNKRSRRKPCFTCRSTSVNAVLPAVPITVEPNPPQKVKMIKKAPDALHIKFYSPLVELALRCYRWEKFWKIREEGYQLL